MVNAPESSPQPTWLFQVLPHSNAPLLPEHRLVFDAAPQGDPSSYGADGMSPQPQPNGVQGLDTHPIPRHELLDRPDVIIHELEHRLVLRQQACACGRIPLWPRCSAPGEVWQREGWTHSTAVIESRTYARSRYSSATMMPKRVARRPYFSRSALVVYNRTSSSRLRGVDMVVQDGGMWALRLLCFGSTSSFT